MKKLLLLSFTCICFVFAARSQTTYYWVGGSGTQTTTGSTAIPWAAASWNTLQDGTGTQRTLSAGNDILIFDGNAPGLAAKTIYIRDMPRDSTGQLKLINGVIVRILTLAPVTSSNGTAAFGAVYGGVTIPVTGTGTDFSTTLRKGDYIFTTGYTNMAEVLSVSSDNDLTIAADASVAQVGSTFYRATALYIKGNPGLTIDAGCSLGYGITLSGSSQLGAFVLGIQPGATAAINGDFSFLSRGNGARLVAQDPGSVIFSPGSTCTVNISGGKFYMLGNTCGTGSSSAATFTFNSGAPAIVFQANSSYKQGTLQTNTPFGVSHVATTPLVFSPAVSFLPNSNYFFTYTNGYQPYFFGNGANFGNLIWNSTATPGATSTTTFSFNPACMDTLQILAMGTPASSTNGGRIVLYGDYINNSTTSCNFGTMVFAGNSLQKISGTNTTAPTGTIIVNDKANVQLQKNITITAAVNNLGKLNVGTYTVTGSGTPAFTNASPFNKTYDKAAGLGNVNSMCAATAGSKNALVFGISTIPVGSSVTCSSHPGLISEGTFVLSYSGGGVYVLSKPATLTADSTSSPALSLNFTNTAGTVTTANAGGLVASLPAITTFNLNAGSNYVFNAATTTPFSGAATAISIGSITANAATTINVAKVTVTDSIILNANIVLPVSDTIVVVNDTMFKGTGTVATNVDRATGSMAVVRADLITASKKMLLSNDGNNLPVTIAPAEVGSFDVTVFTGATTNGLPNGTAYSAAVKDTSVDAGFIIKSATTTNTELILGYPSSLGGTTFNTYNNEIGISHYNGITWDAATGSGNNLDKIATGTFSSFSPFFITHNTNVPLPVRLGNVSANVINGSQVSVNWKVLTEINTEKYNVERSSNSVIFNTIGSEFAQGKNAYSYIDILPVTGVNYYRIKAIDRDGKFIYSSIVSINMVPSKNDLSIFPNPVKGRNINVQFANMDKGKVALSLYNNNGRQLLLNVIDYNGGIYSQSIGLPAGIAPGMYKLVIRSNKKSTQQSVIILP